VEIAREPYRIVCRDPSPTKDVYGGTVGHVSVECMRIRPACLDSTTVIVFSHPIGGGAFLPLISGLAAAGHHVIYCNPRYRGNDTALIMEKCVLDLGACIADAKSRMGYRSVLLGGWSGGGSLSLFYQEQALRPTITHTPAGDPVNLTAAGLIPADGVMLLAAHISRSVTLTEWLDPSVLDEDFPYDREPTLNLYHPACTRPPYDEAFVARYRAAQIARNRRITARVRAQLGALTADGEPEMERPFCVHGTMADLRWLDPSQDPSDRKPGTCYLGDPRIANDGAVGLARFTTLRSWLSQWSYDASAANGIRNAANVGVPVLVVNNGADLACTPSHAQRLFEAVGHPDKELHQIRHADHYYLETPDLVPQAVDLIDNWQRRHGFMI
jgi:pimeloyl-ACP methyl ester carboxylesterase